jgi:hypothetical protein
MWVKSSGNDSSSLVTIGVINKADGKPSSYDCCIQVSEAVRDCSGDSKRPGVARRTIRDIDSRKGHENRR